MYTVYVKLKAEVFDFSVPGTESKWHLIRMPVLLKACPEAPMKVR